MASLAESRKSARFQSGSAALPQGATVPLSHPVMLGLFLLTMTQPYLFVFGTLVMGPYRLALLIFSLPLLFGWVRGKYGGFILSDWLIPAHVLWICLSLMVNGQSASQIVQWGGGQFIDMFVAYLLGRAAIRSKADFYFFVKFFLSVLLILLPFAIVESVLGKMVLQNLFRPLPFSKTFPPITLYYGERLGLRRAMTAFTHPILYGVTAAMGASFALIGMKYYKGGLSVTRRLLWSAGSVAGAFFSVSSGAFMAVGLQLGLLMWERVFASVAARWKILTIGLVSGYIFVDIVANRPPFIVMAKYVALSANTAWNRYLIWQFGSAEVWRHPIFGMGLFTDWIRTAWMPTSVDNHWLLVAMRFGFPGIGLLLAAYFYIVLRLVRLNFSDDPEMDAIRKSFAFVFLAMFFVFVTVAAWHVTYSILLLMLGGAAWIFNEPRQAAAPEASAKTGRTHRPRNRKAAAKPDPNPVSENAGSEGKHNRYTRFPTGR